MTEFRFDDDQMRRILDGCASGDEWWAHHPVLPFVVSNLGRVKGPRGGVLKPHPGGSMGYPTVETGNKHYRVHALVLEAFVGNCPDGMEACHWDDDPQNNALMNLRWDTRSANMHDRHRDARQRESVAQRHAQAVLSRADRPDRHDIARRLAVLERLEQLVT